MIAKTALAEVKRKLCGKRIVGIEASKWSGVVRSLMNNSGYVSITLEDGTVLEAGSLYVRENTKRAPSKTG